MRAKLELEDHCDCYFPVGPTVLDLQGKFWKKNKSSHFKDIGL